MKKTYQFLVVLAAMLLGAMNVSAGERIPLTTSGFITHEGWGADYVRTGAFTGAAYVIGEPTGCAFGDSECNAILDLGGYSKMYVVMAGCDKEGNLDDSTPRVILNTDKTTNTNGDHIICPAGNGAEFCTQEEDGTWVIDLLAIKKKYGFVYITAIKGATWETKVLLTSLEVEKTDADQQVGWVSIINNGNFDTDDLESFPVSKNGPTNGDTANDRPTIMTDDDGLKYIVVASDDNATETWNTQFFIKFNEALPEGAKWRLSFDVKADRVQKVTTSAQGEPRKYNMGGVVPEFDVPIDWTSISAEGTVTKSTMGITDNNPEGNGFLSIAFDLNQDLTTSNNFYFRNIKMEQLKSGLTAKFGGIAIQMSFGFDTNVADLVAAAKAKRLVFPNDCATVKVNGEAKDVLSVEGYADGRFFIFLADMFEATDQVEVTFKNPAGDLQLKYTNGPTPGEAVSDGVATATYDDDMRAAGDLYPYIMENPTITNATPQQGSFRVDPNLKEFKVTFDKKADVSQAVATLDGQALTVAAVNPDESGFSEEIKMTYAGAAMTNGMHTIHLSKVYPEFMIAEEIFTDTTYTFSVGPVDVSDLPAEIIPISYFNNCAANQVPEGYVLYADGADPEVRTPGNDYGSGSRMFDFGGGDFTKGLYIRTWYLTYGEDEEHKLHLEANKSYNVTFNAAIWNERGHSGNHFVKFQLVDATNPENVKFEKTMKATPILAESRNAVKGSAAFDETFKIDAEGDYIAKWVVAKNENGDPANNDWYDLVLANIKMAYIPATYGSLEMYQLEEALAKAKVVQEANGDARYAGEAQTALNNAVAQIEADKDTYTNPSQCTEAIKLLGTTASALSDHAALCKSYDDIISKGADVVDQNKDNKFAVLETYAELKAIVDKYHATSTMTNTGTEEEPVWQRIREFDVLKDDAELTAAVAELTDIVTKTQKMFTVFGKDNSEDSDGDFDGFLKTGVTGVAPMVERLRLGAEAVRVFDPENPIIEEALNAFEDNDELAEKVKNNLKVALYKKIMAGENLFPEDEQTGLTPTYDMSVFFKNPNLYSLAGTKEVPGWDNITGDAGAWSSWDGNANHGERSLYPEDCCLHPGWHAVARTEQTVYDLPAGIYNIKFRGNDNSTTSDGTYGYVRLPETAEVADGGEFDKEANTAGYADVNNSGWLREIPNIMVLDGQLTFGFSWGPESQAFFGAIRIMLAGTADVDYSALYDEVAAGIETAASKAKVRAIELYDLNGQRIPVAKKGIVIVKKQMSDGTVKMEKVIK